MQVSRSTRLLKLLLGSACTLVLFLLLALQGDIVNAAQAVSGALPRAWGLAERAPRQQNGGPILAPTFVHLPIAAQPPRLTLEESQRLQTRQARARLQIPLVPAGSTIVHRPDSSYKTNPIPHIQNQGSNGALPRAGAASNPGDFSFFRNTTLNAAATNGSASLVLSPSVANRGPVVLETGNLFAALSTDGGQTFAYIDPTKFGDPSINFGGLIGNQIVVYDVRRDMYIWVLEYADNGSQNILRLAVSHGSDIVKGNWTFYDIKSDANTRYDFPDLCLSNNNVFITALRGSILPGAQADRAYIFRASLDTLLNVQGLHPNIYFAETSSPFRCTRGATDTMYWASQNSTTQIRVYKWPDAAVNEGGVTSNDVNLSVEWKDVPRNCGFPWCNRVDGRILGAWVAKGLVGFMWSAAQDATNGLPFPYLEAARVNESDLSYFDRPMISDQYGALVFPSVAPNVRGDLGIAFFYGSNQVNPSLFVGVRDDYSNPNWEVNVAQQGQAAALNVWGDWTTVRPFAPTGLGWIASGYALPSGCTTDGCAVPSFLIFGRFRDERSISHYWAATP